jgi:hypothetical protein
VRPEGLGKLKKLTELIGSRTRDLPACIIVPQPLRYGVPPRTLVQLILSIPNRTDAQGPVSRCVTEELKFILAKPM